jgi:hypothetical protein
VALGTLIAGRYSGAIAGADAGIAENGYNLVIIPHAERIAESDAYGQTLFELIYRGVDVGLIYDGLEYKGTVGTSGPLGAIWPWGATFGTMGVIGRLGSAIAYSVILTATAGTPAASTPATLTAPRAIISPGFNVNLLFNSKLRKVPIRFDCMPNDSVVHFSTT